MNCPLRPWVFFAVIMGAFFVFFAEPGFTTPHGQDGLEKIFQIDIQIQGERKGVWQAVARNLIQIRPLDPYDPAVVARAIDRLSDSKVFQSIHVPDPEKTAQGMKIVFELHPFGRIKDIHVKNAFPLFEREVMNMMTISIGDVFIEKRLEDQSKRVTTLFQRQGYIDPQVSLSAQKDEADGNFQVWVHIHKGAFFQVNQVRIMGNDHFSSSRLKLRIKTWKASILFGSAKRFIQKDLDEDVKNFIQFYREKGFAEVKVRAQVLRNEKEKKVDLVFHIEEGTRYGFVFQGNEQFWDHTLNREMTLSREGNENDFALRKSIRNLKQKYRLKGYPDVKVESGVKAPPPDNPTVKQVTLAIDEGDQYCVSKIKITGNRVFSEKTILEQMLTRVPLFQRCGVYVSKTLDEDINAIRAFYLRQGYQRTNIDRRVRVRDDPGRSGHKQVEISLVIDEGIQTKVGQLRFEGVYALSHEAAVDLISLTPGQPFREYMIKTDENRLRQSISELGYPNCQVTSARVLSVDRTRLTLTYLVDEGPHARVGQTYYMGNFRTSPSVLDNEMKLSEGESLSLIRLLESRQNMMNVNALDSVRFRTIGLENKEPKVDIIVEVEEKKPYYVEMGTGYDTERHLYFNSTLGDHNFLGQNLDLKLEAEVSQIGYKADLALLEPRLLTSQIRSNTRVFGEKQEAFNKDFGSRTYGVSQDFYQDFLSRTLILNLGLSYEFREQYLTRYRPLTLEETDPYEPRHVLVASPGILYNTTDSHVRPKKGWVSSVNADISNGLDNSVDDFIKYQLEARYYYTLFSPLVMAFRGRYGFIQPYGANTRVPEDQLFFLGGTSSVRGFDENLLAYDTAGQAVGGREVILGAVEARYDLGLNFEISGFYDIGAIRQTQGRGGSESFRDSVGLGLRYQTPIGPIGFLYGWKLDPRPDESGGSFHFSMGYTF
ncbi:MAG: outer membrane protein assembly factor BamA [Desulfobacter sp.]|nr:outer membrane protein assembly factor BamA [Desulfobacter sp.]